MKGLTVDRYTLSISDFHRLLSLRRTSRASILKTYWLKKKKSAVIFPKYSLHHDFSRGCSFLFLSLFLLQHQNILKKIKCNKHATLAACVLYEALSVFQLQSKTKCTFFSSFFSKVNYLDIVFFNLGILNNLQPFPPPPPPKPSIVGCPESKRRKITRKRVHLIATHPLAHCSFTLRRGVIMMNNRKVRPSGHLPQINNRKTVVGFLNTVCSWSVGKTYVYMCILEKGAAMLLLLLLLFLGVGGWGRKSSQPVRFVEDTRFLQENVSSNVLAFASLTTHYETHLYYYITLKSRH